MEPALQRPGAVRIGAEQAAGLRDRQDPDPPGVRLGNLDLVENEVEIATDIRDHKCLPAVDLHRAAFVGRTVDSLPSGRSADLAVGMYGLLEEAVELDWRTITFCYRYTYAAYVHIESYIDHSI